MVEHIDEVTLRRATPDDAAQIAGVHVRSRQEAYAGIVPADHLRTLASTDGPTPWADALAHDDGDRVHTWVAESAGRVIGFASYGPSRDEDARRGEREIYAIYLDPGTWGHGVARDLVREVLTHAGDQTPMSLWVLADNDRARHFYRRHGFSPDGVERLDTLGGAELLEVRYRRG